jgi:hypothetical protein
MKLNNIETCEKIEHNVKRNVAILEQGGRGSYSGKCLFVGCNRIKNVDFIPAKVCGKSQVYLLLVW